jgi:hypothetical protein
MWSLGMDFSGSEQISLGNSSTDCNKPLIKKTILDFIVAVIDC